MNKLKFLGASGVVTGSKYVLSTPEGKVMIDCGLFQGIKPLRELNWEPLSVDAHDINAVVITHAHLDHTGYLPLLAKRGFKGKIWMSPPTAELAALILRDSAKLQEEDAELANEKGFSRHKPAEPLYTEEDVEKVLKLFSIVEDMQWINLSPNVRFRFRKVAHILGACFIEMDCFDKRIVFSGDIGRKESFTLPPPEFPDKADVLLMESTYGDRLHPTTPVENELADAINDTIRKGGNILLSSFAVGRAQELMVLINKLKQEKKIPDIPVYLDSPMSTQATLAMVHYPRWHKLNPAEDANLFNNVTRISGIKETYRLIATKGSKIIIAASGMLTGGRVLHYLQEYLGSAKNTILITGFQAEGTRGRALINGTHELKIYGKYYAVKAEIRELRGLSAHADQAELLAWAAGIKNKPEKVFIVHGEPSGSYALATKLRDTLDWNAIVPVMNAEFEI